MLCEKCKKNPAVVPVLQLNQDGTPNMLRICTDCSQKMMTGSAEMITSAFPIPLDMLQNISIKGEIPASFENLFQGFMNSLQSMGLTPHGPHAAKTAKNPPEPCTVCGMTYENFTGSRRLGCADCYTAFAKPIEIMLKNVQSGTRHEGKLPQRAGLALRHKREVSRLREQLRAAVADENYEEAARLRDQIKSLEVDA